MKEQEGKWYAVFTKYKCEKYVRDQLRAKEVEVYVPLIKETKRYKTKIRKVEKPLISSYVFVKIELKNYVKVLEVQYVKGFLKIAKEMIAIPDREIEMMKRVVGEKIEKVTNKVMSIGQKVEILSGSMTGMKGILVEVKGKKNFVVSLETIGFEINIQVDPKILNIVD